MNNEAVKYNNNSKRRTSVAVIAMPGAGGPLLLELLALASDTRVTGTQEKSFYNALTVLVESMTSNGNTYGSPEIAVKGENGLRFYGRDSLEYDLRLSAYFIKNLLLKTTSGSGVALVETLEDDDEGWVDRFCNAIRYLDDHDFSMFRIAFLVNDLSEVEYANPIEHNKRLQSYKDAMGLGDMWIKKSDLIKNPKQVLLKLQCNRYPDEDKINSIMKRHELI